MQRPKGTKDVFGKAARLRCFVVKTLEEISDSFNFQKIEVPIFEAKNIFVRSIGETSDIVAKEMYHFQDKSHRDMVLRPEGTAGVIRAVVENRLYAQPLPLKLFYLGPMFRYENPQKGRQRQFTQYGVEVFGRKSPYLDIEVITMAATILDSLKIAYELKINSLGSKTTRDKWSHALKSYFANYKTKLEPISLQRLEKNPTKILDDKIEAKKKFVQAAPNIAQFYSKADKEYLDHITTFLKNFNISFQIDHTLVRGLDYYTDLTFEFNSKSKNVGSHNTIIGGGRYDNLVHQFGGPQLPGIGFAIGIERLINEIQDTPPCELEINPEVYVINLDASATASAFGIVYLLRRYGLKVAWNYHPAKIHKALAKADKAKAFIKVIAGPKELSAGLITVKVHRHQTTIKIEDLIKHIEQIYKANKEGLHEKNK